MTFIEVATSVLITSILSFSIMFFAVWANDWFFERYALPWLANLIEQNQQQGDVK